ncbi:MAG: hypothetical protein EXR82_08060 [Gammaproteobacteria bacterium]|nr:hypothetical protein [Gammaproteobacteria bacterium]
MNRQWRIARYPRADEVIGPAHFNWGGQPVPAPEEGAFLVRTLALAPGPANYRFLVYQRARMQGFVVFDYWQRFSEPEAALTTWYQDGTLRDCEDLDEGLEKMPDPLASLFTGRNRGLRLCRVAPDPAHLPLLRRGGR